MKRVAAMVLAGSLLLGGTAAAQHEDDEDAEPVEIGRTLAQVGLGATVATAGLFLVGATLDAGFAPIVFLLITPAAVGATVCAVGDRGAYRGSCIIAGAAAYAGAASIVPLVYFSAELFPSEPSAEFYIPPQVVIAFLAGWVVVQPVVATFGWRMSSSVKPPPPVAHVPRRPGLGPRTLLFPLLAVDF